MPVRVPVRPRTRAALAPPRAADATTARALTAVAEHVQRMDRGGVLDRRVLTADLAIGANKIPHGLARRPRGYTITPTVADAAFAHALDAGASDASWITINVTGAAQPGATIEVF